jgi:hypothetical protein
MYILNALPATVILGANGPVDIVKISEEMACVIVACRSLVSAVGHQDTAALFSTLLDADIPMNRISAPALTASPLSATEEGVTIFSDFGSDGRPAWMLCGLLNGPRLPEGSTNLPQGAWIQWVLVAPLEVTLFGGDTPRLVSAARAIADETYLRCQFF